VLTHHCFCAAWVKDCETFGSKIRSFGFPTSIGRIESRIYFSRRLLELVELARAEGRLARLAVERPLAALAAATEFTI
jgi:hypothetical protein